MSGYFESRHGGLVLAQILYALLRLDRNFLVPWTVNSPALDLRELSFLEALEGFSSRPPAPAIEHKQPDQGPPVRVCSSVLMEAQSVQGPRCSLGYFISRAGRKGSPTG